MTWLPLVLLFAAQVPAQAPAASAEYYLSETRVLAPDGKALGALVGLGKREYRPDRGIVRQTDIAVDPAANGLPTVVVTDWTVAPDGTTATLAESGRRLVGKATLGGPAWAWTGWNWTGTMKDVPGTFRTGVRRTPRGAIVRTEHLDAAGKRLEFFDQADTAITKETYDVLRARLLPEK